MQQNPQQSLLEYYYWALGLKYAIALPLAAAFSFVMTAIVVLRGRGAPAIAAILLLAPLPVYLGMMAAADGFVASGRVIALGPVAPNPAELVHGFCMAMAPISVGMFLAIPGFLVASMGMLIRSLVTPAEGSR